MKTKILTAAVIAAMLTLTACGDADTKTTSESKADTTTTAATEPALTEEITTQDTTAPVTEETTTSVTTLPPVTEATTTTTTEPEPVVPTELSDKYADLDNRSFKYNGKIMTLGASTLQDFVDAGAELDEWLSISHAGKNFEVQFDDHFSGQFPYGCAIYYLDEMVSPGVDLYFITPHDSPCKLKECILAKISVDVDRILTPGPDNNVSENLEFAFDRSLTYDSLVANSGEPNYEDAGYHYIIVSEKTPKYDSGYRFSFDSDGLSRLEMTWIP
jgi:predicted small lipoprotein YifL